MKEVNMKKVILGVLTIGCLVFADGIYRPDGRYEDDSYYQEYQETSAYGDDIDPNAPAVYDGPYAGEGSTGEDNCQTCEQSRYKATAIELNTLEDFKMDLKMSGINAYSVDTGEYYIVRNLDTCDFKLMARIKGQPSNFIREYSKLGEEKLRAQIGTVWIFDVRKSDERKGLNIITFKK